MDNQEFEAKIMQAYRVINWLLEETGRFESEEGLRALNYFSEDRYDPGFLPWPHVGADGVVH